VLVILDSNHSKAHVSNELEAYHRFVSKNSYIVATDGIMQFVHDAPRGRPEWRHDNPSVAAMEFAARHDNFVLAEPKWSFNESNLLKAITSWPGAWLKRIA
jgi:cephalosporin hydroxylase